MFNKLLIRFIVYFKELILCDELRYLVKKWFKYFMFIIFLKRIEFFILRSLKMIRVN